MDLRERLGRNPEEFFRMLTDGLKHQDWQSMPVIVHEDSDGKSVSVRPTIKGKVKQEDGSFIAEDLPILKEVPVHFSGGGGGENGGAGTSITHPIKKGDEGFLVFFDRNSSAWRQSGGQQNPVDWRSKALADAAFIPQIRSKPRELKQVSTTSSQIRSDDKKHVIDQSPTDGTKIRAVDPSTQAASDSFDPFTQATKFFDHIVHPSDGHAMKAMADGVLHAITNTHAAGPLMAALNGAHSVAAHPENGVGIISNIAHTISAPNANLDAAGNFSALQSISAPLGAIGGMSFGGGGGGGAGGLTMSGKISGGTLQSTDGYTVATLPLPTTSLRGTRAYVTDAIAPIGETVPKFMDLAIGGGTIVCPVFCTGLVWVTA